MILRTSDHDETLLHQAVEIRQACTTSENIDDYPTIFDLRVLLAPDSGEPSVQASIWEDENHHSIAFAIIHLSYRNLYFYVLPQYTGSGIDTQIVSWAIERISETRIHDGSQISLDSPCGEHDTLRETLLMQQGFILQEEQSLHMTRSLTDLLAKPQLPAGFTLRPVEGPHEVEAYIEMHRDAFGTEHMTIEHRLSIMWNPDYVPALDLIAVAADGTFAAFCISRVNREANARNGRNEGEIEIIGTRPRFQGQGLGKAMLLAGLQSLREYGIEIATLGTSSTNTTAIQLYESVGFQVARRTLWYARNV
jgi:mycothiol synthase